MADKYEWDDVYGTAGDAKTYIREAEDLVRNIMNQNEIDKKKNFKIGVDAGKAAGYSITQILDDAGTGGVALPNSTEPDLNSSGGASDTIHSLIQGPGQKYQLGGMVAKGGMGMIFSASDINVRRQIAMKLLLPGKENAPAQVVRFIEEAQVTGQLEHPGIVPVYELGVDAAGNVFYTMKLIKGHTLMDILHKLRKGDKQMGEHYNLSYLLTVFQKICDAVAYANSKNVVHRDLKPDNVMVGEYGEVLVLDWGLAKVLNSSMPISDGITGDPESMREAVNSLRQDESHKEYETLYGLVMGTPRFMAPEQALGMTDAIDGRTDVYALGAILYNILTLHSPVKGDTVKDQLLNVINGDIPYPTKFGRHGSLKNDVSLRHCPEGDVPEGLAAVAMKALSVQKADRYASVQELQSDIEAWQNGFATEAENAGAGRMFGLFLKRHKPMVTVSAASFFIIIGLLITFAVNAKMGETRALQAQALAEAAQEDAENARIAIAASEQKLREMSVKAAGLGRWKKIIVQLAACG